MAHGGGGRLMHDLIERVFLGTFPSSALAARHDGAVLDLGGARIAFTTDAYVVSPLEFPGGSIGSLAVYGTVNDLAMCGAEPRWLSVAFVLEEGLPLALLERLTRDLQAAAERAGVEVVTGDTKVVDRGRGDGLYLTTAGVGVVLGEAEPPCPERVAAGDALIVSGDLGRHGVAVLSRREGLKFETEILSDCAPLNGLVRALLAGGVDVHCLRDLTRGGLTSALVEVAEARGLTIEVDERAVPICEEVRGACELLGLDPLSVANEGRLVAFVPAAEAERALAILRAVPLGAEAAQIGSVLDPSATGASPPGVVLRTAIGSRRTLDMLSGEQLPRIC
jgi:hydrogenase expression/formation protein HypE